MKANPSDVSELEVAIKLEDRLLRKQGLRFTDHKADLQRDETGIGPKPNAESRTCGGNISKTRLEVYFSREQFFMCGLFGLAFWSNFRRRWGAHLSIATNIVPWICTIQIS